MNEIHFSKILGYFTKIFQKKRAHLVMSQVHTKSNFQPLKSKLHFNKYETKHSFGVGFDKVLTCCQCWKVTLY